MAVLKSNDGHEFILDCNCGCDDGFKLKFTFDEFDFFKDAEDPNLEELLGTDMCYGSYTNSSFYSGQDTFFSKLKVKLRKIIVIIRNKDYYYSEICMNVKDFIQYRKCINDIYNQLIPESLKEDVKNYENSLR